MLLILGIVLGTLTILYFITGICGRELMPKSTVSTLVSTLVSDSTAAVCGDWFWCIFPVQLVLTVMTLIVIVTHVFCIWLNKGTYAL
jgi:hypothetical protein